MGVEILSSKLSEANLSETSVTVADAVWLATAILQRASGPDSTFPPEQIVMVAVASGLSKGQQSSIRLHVSQHCVANRKAQPNRLRYLFATDEGHRRLWRKGDPWDITRDGAATHPAWEKLPTRFAEVQQWYEEEWSGSESEAKGDPLLALIGSGRHIWADEHADEYVDNLRRNWDTNE
jgi:hypothetical protein